MAEEEEETAGKGCFRLAFLSLPERVEMRRADFGSLEIDMSLLCEIDVRDLKKIASIVTFEAIRLSLILRGTFVTSRNHREKMRNVVGTVSDMTDCDKLHLLEEYFCHIQLFFLFEENIMLYNVLFFSKSLQKVFLPAIHNI